MAEKLRLINHYSPGDALVMTGALECLHGQYPDRYLTDVDTSCNAVFENSPRITHHAADDPDVREVQTHHDLINFSDQRPVHFLHGYVEQLRTELGLPLAVTTNRPHIYLTPAEMAGIPLAVEHALEPLKYWIVNAGTKQDYTCKGWGHSRYQRVVDELAGTIRFVQIGEAHHLHKPLENVVNLMGRTSARELIRLCWNAAGGLGPVTFVQHIFAAFEKPYVALYGGREPVNWTHYATQTALSTVGALTCCRFGGCWKSRVVPLGDGERLDNQLCAWPVYEEEPVPKCMTLIHPADVARAILRYYEGGVLQF